MKILKRLIFVVAMVLVVGFLVPTNALAADSDLEITVTFAPAKIAPLGGDIKVTVVVKNSGSTPITWIRTDFLTNVTFTQDWSGNLPAGDSKTLIRMVPFVASDLGHNISVRVYIENDGDASRDGRQMVDILVEEEDNVFLTEATNLPEGKTFYVGDTVKLKDRFRNGLTIPATDVSVQYYYRVTGKGTDYGDTIALDDAAGGASLFNTFDYTFKEADIGEYRIGSQITYKAAGKGPYQEYNAAHDFIVKAAPTPSPTLVATPTPSPTPTIEASGTLVPAISATPVPSATTIVEQPSAIGDASTELGGNQLLLVLIIVLGLVLIAVIILIIIVIVRKKN